jgi:hypothetical protein
LLPAGSSGRSLTSCVAAFRSILELNDNKLSGDVPSTLGSLGGLM